MAATITGRPVVAASEKCEREVCGTTVKYWTYTDPTRSWSGRPVAAASKGSGPGQGRQPDGCQSGRGLLVLHDVVVPGMPVNEVVEFEALEPGAVEEMVARGLVPQWPTDAIKLYPRIYSAREGRNK